MTSHSMLLEEQLAANSFPPRQVEQAVSFPQIQNPVYVTNVHHSHSPPLSTVSQKESRHFMVKNPSSELSNWKELSISVGTVMTNFPFCCFKLQEIMHKIWSIAVRVHKLRPPHQLNWFIWISGWAPHHEANLHSIERIKMPSPDRRS